MRLALTSAKGPCGYAEVHGLAVQWNATVRSRYRPSSSLMGRPLGGAVRLPGLRLRGHTGRRAGL